VILTIPQSTNLPGASTPPLHSVPAGPGAPPSTAGRILQVRNHLMDNPTQDLLKAAGVAVRFGLAGDDAIAAILQWNNTRQPPSTRAELRAAIEEARSSAPAPPAPTASAPRAPSPAPRPASSARAGSAPHAAPHVSAPHAAPHVSAPHAAPHVSAPDAEPHNDSAAQPLAAEVWGWLQRYAGALFEVEGKIRLDIRSGKIMVGDTPMSIDDMRALFQRNLGRVPDAVYHDGKHLKVRQVPNEVLQPQLIALAKHNQFDPVTEYLTELPPWDGIDRIPGLVAALHLENLTPLHETFLRKFTIGAVARATKPGSKHDTVTILQDRKGGKFKSTAFRALAGRTKYGQDLFTDTKIQTDNKDSLMLLNKFWIIEMSEMVTLTSARSRESALAFISSQEDTFRAPYARETESHPRRSVFVGSTNKDTFLESEGGNRRFWIIPNVGRIDVEKIAAMRDQIWAQAFAEYHKGSIWWLTEEEDPLLAEALEEHVHEEVGAHLVAQYVAPLEYVTVDDIMTIGPEMFRASTFHTRRAQQMSIAKILMALGWTKRRGLASVAGRRAWFWFRGPTAAPQQIKTVNAPAGIFHDLLKKERKAAP